MTVRGHPIFSGLADEAAPDIAGQIAVHRDLGWNAMELRLVNNLTVTAELGEGEFDQVVAQVESAGMAITGLASKIGNWGRAINGDFAVDVAELRRAIGRMRRLGTTCIRTMSWVGDSTAERAWRREVLRRYRELVKIAEDGGVVLLHENCSGWAGRSAANMVELVSEIDSPHLGLMFDIGNTISHGHEPWAFYQGMRQRIRYVHVKDARCAPDGTVEYTYPGEGQAQLRRILADLLRTGYAGVLAIEPHVASVIHRGNHDGDPVLMRASYQRYARAFLAMVAEIRRSLSP